MATDRPHLQTHRETNNHSGNVFEDFNREVKEEIQGIKGGGEPTHPRSDVLVRKHLNGLVIILFAFVAIILLAAIVGIAIYSHGHTH